MSDLRDRFILDNTIYMSRYVMSNIRFSEDVHDKVFRVLF